MKKVLITGTFDILHPGHINLIKQAENQGDFLVILIARDRTVEKTKGRKSFYSENQRLQNIKKLVKNLKLKAENVKVVLGDLENPYKVIEVEKPDVIAIGYDQQSFVDNLEEKIKSLNSKTKVVKLKPFYDNICRSRKLRKALEDSESGFLLINKEEDWTSHDVVAKLRSILKIKAIGHAGTLDPFATGLLICAIGKATKMIDLFHLLPKEYEAEIKLGVISDTYDRTGEIKSSKFMVQSSKEEIAKILKIFVGKQEQLPPMYSAKKIQGKKLYELARKGKEVERKPSEIEIYDIELLEVKDLGFKIKVNCSAGTYIRSLAHDIGQKLDVGAILNELKRTAIGDFKLKQAVKLEELTLNNCQKYLIKPEEVINRVNEYYGRSVWQ